MNRTVLVLGLAALAGCSHGQNDCNEEAFKESLGSSVGEARYDARFDLDASGTITTKDFSLFLNECKGA